MSKAWDKISSVVGNVAPALGLALGGPAGAAVGQVIAGWLGTADTPEAVAAALADPAGRERLLTLYSQHAHEIAILELQAQMEIVRQTNESLRAEVQSEDPYVRRARPGFVYALKWTWIAQVGCTFAGAVIAIFAESLGSSVDAGQVLIQLAKLNADTTLLWGPALAVIGIYNVKRSNDKQVAAGQTPTTLLGSIFSRG